MLPRAVPISRACPWRTVTKSAVSRRSLWEVCPKAAQLQTRPRRAVLPCVDWVKRHLRRASGTEHRLARSVRLLLPLAHFAPRILRAIVDGRLPRRIGVRHLAALPASWVEQERALGLGEQDNQEVSAVSRLTCFLRRVRFQIVVRQGSRSASRRILCRGGLPSQSDSAPARSTQGRNRTTNACRRDRPPARRDRCASAVPGPGSESGRSPARRRGRRRRAPPWRTARRAASSPARP
jgi:hypothetical protein